MPYNYDPRQVPQPTPQQNMQMMQPQQSIPQVLPQQNIQPLFPQPQGNVYNINSTLEVANVPVGAGVSVALCLPENLMYIKTMQNGNPLFYPYKIEPFNSTPPQEASPQEDTMAQFVEKLKSFNEKIEELEEKIAKLSKHKGDDWAV